MNRLRITHHRGGDRIYKNIPLSITTKFDLHNNNNNCLVFHKNIPLNTNNNNIWIFFLLIQIQLNISKILKL